MSLSYKFRKAMWNLRTKIQRFRRGYADADVIDIDNWFIETATPLLKEFRAKHIAYPAYMTKEEYDGKLDEMIRLIELMDEDNVMNYLGITYDRYECQKVNDVMEENKNKFFTLFSELFYWLWD